MEPGWKGVKGEVVDGEEVFRLPTSLLEEVSTEENVEAKGEGAAGFWEGLSDDGGRRDCEEVEVRLFVERGVRPRREPACCPGIPQADGCVLTILALDVLSELEAIED